MCRCIHIYQIYVYASTQSNKICNKHIDCAEYIAYSESTSQPKWDCYWKKR